MKSFRHRKTGEVATYKDGVLKSSGFCVEIGVEPSKEFWEEVKETYPIGTEVKDTWTGSVYKKKTEKEWIISDASPKYDINESEIGKYKRFTLVEKPFTLPKKWCIRPTYEQRYEVFNYFKSKDNTFIGDGGDAHKYCWYVDDSTYRAFLGGTKNDLGGGYTEITFEQFKEYVLKEESVLFTTEDGAGIVTGKQYL